VLAALMLAASACSPLQQAHAVGNAAQPAQSKPAAVSLPKAPNAAGNPAPAGELSLEDLYVRANPAVVNITAVTSATAASGFQDLPSLPGFPDLPAPDSGAAVAQGSGFVYDQQGHIVTNNHVVEGAHSLMVTFADGVEVAAQVVGASPDTDLAVLQVKVDASELHPLALGESDSLKVGQSVVAIGNPFGLEGSMTSGIISGLGRLLEDGGQTADGRSYSLPDIIQTDAAINPGNSGGPLLDLAGDVIGVNTAIESPVRASSGVGYSIPVDLVRQVVPALIKDGQYHVPYLGLSGQTLHADLARAMGLDAQQRGVLVAEVVAGSPVERAGLQGSTTATQVDGLPAKIGGDVIVSIDGHPVQRFDDLLSYLVRHTTVGQTVTLQVLRAGKDVTLDIELAARPTNR
jgi:2-alkenal reductase